MTRRAAPDPIEAERAAVDAAAVSVAIDVANGDAVLAGETNRWRRMAAVFGRLVAQGVLDLDEALAPMQVEAAKRWPAMNAGGRATRIGHLLHDSAQEWRWVRERTRFAIRRALGPLLAERRASAALLAAARAVNEAAGGPLRDAEVIAEVRREVYWAGRAAARDARRRA